MNIGLVGYGKMGAGIANALDKNDKVLFIAEPGLKSAEVPVFPAIGKVEKSILDAVDVVVEFTVPAVSRDNILEIYKRRPDAKVVCGTTGWDPSPLFEKIKSGSGSLIYSANYSIGINVLLEVLPHLGRMLVKSGGFDTSMVELHHKRKLDSPSGTAKVLAAALESSGMKIPVSSIRSGSFPGTHSMFFDSMYETIELTHTARDRSVFCTGALLAARWLCGKSGGGVFSFRDVINDLIRE